MNAEAADARPVLGEVVAPGSSPFVGRDTVLDAIVAAGGLSDRAAPCDIILSRPTSPGSCRIVMPICYNQIVQLGDSTTNYQLMPGDRIYVAADDLESGTVQSEAADSTPMALVDGT